MWPTRIKLALDCLSFYFDEAVKIIGRDVDETLCLIVHKINRVRKDFFATITNNPPQSRSISPAFDLTDYS